MIRRRLSRLAATAGGLILLGLLVVALASGERAQQGNLIVSLNGGVSPLALPRNQAEPVAVNLEGTLATADRSTLPRVEKMEIAFSGHGSLATHGFPTCPIGRLRSRRTRQALEVCRQALVGHGSLEAEVLLPAQPAFTIHARLLLFNGRTAAGRPALLLHGYTARPPTAVVVPFVLHHREGSFPNVLIGRLPRSLGPWPRLARFKMTLGRRISRLGAHSFIHASCPVPGNFTAGFLSFARSDYELADGSHVGTEIVRSCRAAR